jgi:hypothetical protein
MVEYGAGKMIHVTIQDQIRIALHASPHYKSSISPSDAMCVSEIVESLHLRKLTGRWYVQPAMAIQGEGLSEAMMQLDMVKSRRAEKLF